MAKPVLLLLDAHDIGGAAIGGEQIGAVLGPKEFVERGDAREEADEVVFHLCPLSLCPLSPRERARVRAASVISWRRGLRLWNIPHPALSRRERVPESLPARGEYGGDEIVADALLAQMDLEAVGEKGEELISNQSCLALYSYKAMFT